MRNLSSRDFIYCGVVVNVYDEVMGRSKIGELYKFDIAAFSFTVKSKSLAMNTIDKCCEALDPVHNTYMEHRL